MIWHERLRRRIAGEEPGVPWGLVGKLGYREFCTEIGARTVPLLAIYPTVADIDLAEDSGSVVLKATNSSTSRGVLVLERTGEDAFTEVLSRRSMTASGIRSELAAQLEAPPSPRCCVVAESRLRGAGGEGIPHDFKAYSFQGEIALILEVNRNTSPPEVSWYDGRFRPVHDGRVTVSPEHAREVRRVTPPFATQLLRLARRVSVAAPTPFLRVDMFWTGEEAVVGELTLTPGGVYYGDHYRLSPDQEVLMGLMWDAAEERLGQ